MRIELCDIEPLIWRRIVVPTSWPMSTLHNYVQWVMGWQDTHPHEFRVLEKVIASEWWLKETSLDRDSTGDRDERRVKVGTVISEAATTDGEFEYLYDMGDDWRHRLVHEADIGARVLESDLLPLCTAGENACPPDDIGGPHGYVRFLAALADPEDEEHSSMLSWVGGVFDPRGFDLNHLNRDWQRKQARVQR